MLRQNRVSGEFAVLTPHRQLVREGTLKVSQSKGIRESLEHLLCALVTLSSLAGFFGSMKLVENHFFLFNDALLWVDLKSNYKGLLYIICFCVAFDIYVCVYVCVCVCVCQVTLVQLQSSSMTKRLLEVRTFHPLPRFCWDLMDFVSHLSLSKILQLAGLETRIGFSLRI